MKHQLFCLIALASLCFTSCERKIEQPSTVKHNLTAAMRTVPQDERTTYYADADDGSHNPCDAPQGNCMPEISVTPSTSAFVEDLLDVAATGTTTDIKNFFSDPDNYAELSIFFLDEDIDDIAAGTHTFVLTHPGTVGSASRVGGVVKTIAPAVIKHVYVIKK